MVCIVRRNTDLELIALLEVTSLEELVSDEGHFFGVDRWKKRAMSYRRSANQR